MTCFAFSAETIFPNKKQDITKLKVYIEMVGCIAVSAGQRARVPPDPIPNSEVKPCSVPNCSAVLGHANLGKLATFL